ncbi:diadenylate cyclase [Fibrobacter sp. HC4]|uniref:diadenylate cyclase n=1 Tax=Fibrobacter sp. HC4 TaxID=3239812 RepID=UPI002018F548
MFFFLIEKKYNSVKKISMNVCENELNVSLVLKSLFCESIIEFSYKNIEHLIKNLTSESGKDFGEKISPNEISRAIGRDFISFIAMTCVRDANMHGGVANALHFFENISQVSLEKYEKKELLGRVLLAPPNSNNIDIAYKFKEKISFNTLRLLRKVLELTNDTFYLLFDGFFYGIGTLNEREITTDNEVYVVRFEGLGFWNLYRMSDSEILLNIKNGIPSIPCQKIDQEWIEQKYKDVFGEESKGKFKDLYVSVYALINQNKGGILLISNAAKEQSDRLKTQAILVDPFSINENSITKLSSIDGAVMVDESGICYAIGLIFDGMVPASGGDSSRGSRYNSSVRFTEYLKSQGKKVMTIVVSDDGMVDLL